MIINNNTGKIISQKERCCQTLISQALGLMFRRRQNLVMEFPIERRVSLHMMMVFFPIDVILLDKEKKVVDIKRNFKPWTIWSSAVPAQYVIELGEERGSKSVLKPLAISLGDHLEMKI